MIVFGFHAVSDLVEKSGFLDGDKLIVARQANDGHRKNAIHGGGGPSASMRQLPEPPIRLQLVPALSQVPPVLGSNLTPFRA